MGDTLNENPAQYKTDAFLGHFPIPQRAGIANQFFNAYRSGAVEVEDLIAAVKADAILRTVVDEGDRLETQRRLLELLRTDEARVYAQEIIRRESLPSEEKQRIRVERREHYRREYMRAQPPTERQLRFLKSLGSTVIPANRYEASVVIDGHVRQ